MTKQKLYAVFACFILACLCLMQTRAADLYDTLLEDMKNSLTDNDIGRVFILRKEFPMKNGPTFQPGTRMILQGISSNGNLICYPDGLPGKKTYRINKHKLLYTPFFDGTPALAYSQLVLEIFAAPDLYQRNLPANNKNPNRQIINTHIIFFLDAIPRGSNDLGGRISVIRDVLEKADEVRENLFDDYAAELAEQKAMARESAKSAMDDDEDDGGCPSCPRQSKIALPNLRNVGIARKRKHAKPVISSSLSTKEKMRIIQDNLGPFYKSAEAKINEALSNQDLILAIAIYVNARHFTETALSHYKLGGAINQMDDLKDLEAALHDQIEPFFQDEGCRDNVQNYTKLFPGTMLLFNEQPPSSYRSFYRMLDRTFHAYTGIYENSPEADFANWGRCNLDYLLFVGNAPFASELVRDYFDQLRSYKLSLKESQSQTGSQNGNSGEQESEKNTHSDTETNQQQNSSTEQGK